MKRLVIIALSCMLLFACASKAPKKVDSAGNLYVDGVNLMNAKKWDKAVEKFTAIRENHPFDPLALVATVKLGDVYFEKKEYLLAVGIYDDFFNTHPDDENIQYVLMRLGECYEKLALTTDRDQAYTLKGIERLTYLKNRFPSTTYRNLVDGKLRALTQRLADRELYVGEFYYRSYQYNAAIIRLEYMLKKYPEAQGIDKALYYLGLSHRALGNREQSEHYMDRLRSEYPKSPLLRSSVRERKTLQLASATFPPQAEGRERRDVELIAQTTQGTQPQQKEERKEGLAFFDEKKPVDIVSDNMEGFDKEKYVVFKGSVVAKQADLYIFSDVIEAYMNEANNEVQKANAKGNVKIVKRDRTATCEEAVFDNARGLIVLKGNVVVHSGGDRVTGNLVTYFVNEDRVVVEGEKEKRAHVTINPK